MYGDLDSSCIWEAEPPPPSSSNGDNLFIINLFGSRNPSGERYQTRSTLECRCEESLN